MFLQLGMDFVRLHVNLFRSQFHSSASVSIFTENLNIRKVCVPLIKGLLIVTKFKMSQILIYQNIPTHQIYLLSWNLLLDQWFLEILIYGAPGWLLWPKSWSQSSGTEPHIGLLGGEPASPSPCHLPTVPPARPSALNSRHTGILCQINKWNPKKKRRWNIQLRGFIYKTVPTQRERSPRTSILKSNR